MSDENQASEHSEQKLTPEIVKEKIEEHLAEMRKLFTPGCKLTFLMRKPKIETAYIIYSDDTEVEIIKHVAKIRMQRQVKDLGTDAARFIMLDPGRN